MAHSLRISERGLLYEFRVLKRADAPEFLREGHFFLD
jgi:hypothetical protein